MNTQGGFEIQGFKLDPEFNKTKDYPFKYKGFIKNVPFLGSEGSSDYHCKWNGKGECRNSARYDCFIDANKAEDYLNNNTESLRTYTEEEIRQAVEFGLTSFDEFDSDSNYDEESRAEGLKNLQDEFVISINKEQ